MASLDSHYSVLIVLQFMSFSKTPILSEPFVLSWYVNSSVKRCFDISFSLIIMPVGLLLLLPICCVHPFFSKGYLFFRHFRVGKNGRRFYLYKIRSLKSNNNILRAGMVKDDGTVIPVLGNFIRQTRIDELPQVWNILKGDMTWVGPRPEQFDFVIQCINEYPAFNARHAVKPGITGLAQIKNPNATIDDYQEKLVYDLEYMATATLWLDIKILCKSLVVVCR